MKHEAPAFRMIVQDGHLVPAAAWDQERLSTYRNRSTVNVHITQEKNRKLERKYWAILHRVVAQCPVRQRTAEDLHKAIRLKLGIVDAFWTIDGRLRVEIKSTSTMEDPEYSAFYEEAMALLQEITGVNPETLSAESADVGDDEDQETSEAPPASGEGSDGTQAPRPTPAVAADEPADAADQEAGEPEADHGGAAAPASDLITKNLMVECLDKFMALATDQSVPDPKQRRSNVEFAKNAWKDALPQRLDFVKACFETSDKVVKGELQAAPARKYLESLP